MSAKRQPPMVTWLSTLLLQAAILSALLKSKVLQTP